MSRRGRLAISLLLLAFAATAHVAGRVQGSPAEQTLADAQRAYDSARQTRTAGKYDDALALAQRALQLREQVLPPDHLDVAHSLHQVALIYDDKHEYAKAEPLNLRALAIREHQLGPDHPDVARSLFNLAWLEKVKQNFAKAESLYQRALDIQERALGPDHPDVATTLNDLAVLYNQTGRHEDAIRVNQRVLAIRERTLGPDDAGVAKALNNLARVYEAIGDYPTADATLRRSLAIWEKANGPDHPEVAFAVDGLAKIRTWMGDFAAAEPLFLRALAIRERSLGLEHTFVAPTLTNLALVYIGQGHPEKAEPLYRRALAIQEKAFGPSHSSVGITLNRLAELRAQLNPGDPGDAESLFQRALSTLEKAVGPEHNEVASSLIGLGGVALRRGQRDLARETYQRALTIQERTFGPSHLNVADSLERLAGLLQTEGDVRERVTMLSRAYDIRERHLEHNLPLGTERQRIGHLKLFADDTDRALSMLVNYAPGDTGAIELALSTALRRKGRALDVTSDSIGQLRTRAAPEERVLFDRLADARAQLAALTLRGPVGVTGTAYARRLRQLETAVENLEADLSARSVAFRAQSQPITLSVIRSALPADATLIEFVRYQPRDANDKPLAARYAAFTVGMRDDPRWRDLGEAAALDRAANAWRTALADPRRSDVYQLGRAVDALVMQPLRAQLGSVQHLLIAPDGPLNLIPFAALVDEQQHALIERYTISYLTSGRDLLRLLVGHENRGDAVVVAAPAFGEPALVAARPSATAAADERQRPQVDYSQIFFGPLPGVSDEVRALRTLLPRAAFLTGERATETAVRQLAGPRLLHVATHGFFLADDDQAGANPPPPATRIGKWSAWSENPLLRSGLALSGANNAAGGRDDGVMTALEVASLDLWGTKLVVLSACDTGLGEVKNGDGVYGLRRALVLAGSESQMMSLWRVSDRSTRDLMVLFYERLTGGAGRSHALRQSQLQLKQNARFSHPYYWASFIQSGQWTNVNGTR